jgi:lysophospholipase L1-like esterase
LFTKFKLSSKITRGILGAIAIILVGAIILKIQSQHIDTKENITNDKSKNIIPTQIAESYNWVGTWAASPYLVTPDNMPPSPGLSNNTLRQVVRVSIAGEKIRLKFSNEYGKTPLTMNSVHLAEAVESGKSSIKPNTDKVLKFQGNESVTIPAGATVVSDTLDYSLKQLTELAITIHFGSMPTELTGHPGSRTTSYIQAGNAVDVLTMSSAIPVERWYVSTGIDVVVADNSYKAVVALGDSITDGRGVTTNANNRWTDVLASRLQGNSDTSKVAVLNQGIGGNGLFGGLGPAAIKRFDRDALGQNGSRYLIIFEGINDIGGARDSDAELSTRMIDAYKNLISKAHEKNMLVYGGTITPCGGNSYYSDFHEQTRNKVNEWIRTSGEFDAVIDFDVAIRDTNDPTKLLNTYDSGDHLHPNPEGYKKMGEAIDLKLFTK